MTKIKSLTKAKGLTKKTAYQLLVERVGLEAANAEMRRRSLRAKRVGKGYFYQLKVEGRTDELKKLATKGGSIPRVRER